MKINQNKRVEEDRLSVTGEDTRMGDRIKKGRIPCRIRGQGDARKHYERAAGKSSRTGGRGRVCGE
jgi:hypothetical protein